MDNLGTLKTNFGRKYVYLNPDPFEGPPTWRLSNIPGQGGVSPEDGTLKDIYTVLPINKTEIGTSINLLFDISGLDDVRTAAHRPNYIRTILSTFLSHAHTLPRASRSGLKKLVGIDPIKTLVNGDIGVVYFDMSDLPSIEDVSRRRQFNISPGTFRYNNRSIDSLTATDPLYSQTAGETATVSIDFRNLPEA